MKLETSYMFLQPNLLLPSGMQHLLVQTLESPTQTWEGKGDRPSIKSMLFKAAKAYTDDDTAEIH